MPTQLMWEAISLSFSLNRYLYRTPIGYNRNARILTHTKLTFRKHWPWLTVVYGLFLGFTGLCNAYVLIKNEPGIKKFYKITAALILAGAAFISALGLQMIFLGRTAISGINQFVRVHENVESFCGKVLQGNQPAITVQIRNKTISIPKLRKENCKLDYMGILLCLVLCCMQFLPHIIVPVGLVYRLDNYQFPVRDLLGQSVNTHPVFLVTMTTVAYLCNFETIRMVPYVMILLFLPIIAMTEVLDNLSNCTHKDVRLIKLVGYLQMIQLEFRRHEGPLAVVLFVLMGFGLVLITGLNYAAVTFLSDPKVPPQFVITFIFLSFGVTMIAASLLHFGGSMVQNRERIRKKLIHVGRIRRVMATKDGRILEKSANAVCPMKIWAGLGRVNFYHIGKHTGSAYFEQVVERTADLLLAF